MSAVSLPLDLLQITSSDEGLELSVESSLSFECSAEGSHSLANVKLLDLLYSGKVWVYRGPGYRLNFTILFNGQHLNLPSTKNTIGDLGKYLRHAPCWSQVSMDPKLQFTCYDDNIDLRPDFCISLQHSMSDATLCQPKGSLLSPCASVQAPASVPCFHLQKIEIIMNFRERRRNRLGRSKEKSTSAYKSATFDGAGNIVNSVYGRSDTPFSLLDGIVGKRNALSLLQQRSDISSAPFYGLLHDSEEILDDCMVVHKFDTGRLTSTSRLAPPSPSGVSSVARPSEDEENGTILEGMASSTPDISTVKKMTDFAIRHLIGGRQIKNQPGIKIMKPQPQKFLSELAPGLWSPGFLQAMSQHSQFLPVISNTISYSVLRDAQSPSLRRKLATLTENRVGMFHKNASNDDASDRSGDDESDFDKTAGNLNQIIRGSLWRMMRLSLYDPLSARRLLPAPEPGAHDTVLELDGIIEEDEEYDASQDTPCDSQPHTYDLFSTLAAEADDFNDLFDELPEEEQEEYADFEALLDHSGLEDSRFDFEDLFSARAPTDHAVSIGDTLEGVFEADRIDIDMTCQDSSYSCEFSGKGRQAEILLDARYDRATEMQIDNESMLI